MRRGSAWIATALLLASACVLSPGSAHAQNEDTKYRELVRHALAEFDAKNWMAARELFRQAHAVQPSARTLRGLGMVAFEMQDFLEARQQLAAALRDPRKPLEGALRTETEALLGRTRSSIGRARVALQPRNARLRLDGRPVELPARGELWMKPGDHVLAAEADGHHAQRVEFDIAGGDDMELEIRLERTLLATPSSPAESGHEQAVSVSLSRDPDDARDDDDAALTERWWFWAGAGVLAAGIGTAVVLLARPDEPERAVPKGTGGVVITTLSLP